MVGVGWLAVGVRYFDVPDCNTLAKCVIFQYLIDKPSAGHAYRGSDPGIRNQ